MADPPRTPPGWVPARHRSRVPSCIRRLLFLACVPGVLGVCGPAARPAQDDEEPASVDVVRRSALRDTLRAELGAAYDQPVTLDAKVRWDRGEQLYQLLCLGCHGPDGSGAGRVSEQLSTWPGDLSLPEDEAFFSARGRQEIVRGGSPGTPMIAWGETLTEADLQALFKYLVSLQRVDR